MAEAESRSRLMKTRGEPVARTVLTKGLVFDGTGAADVIIDGDRVVAVTEGWAEDHAPTG
jgi:hypothetical protein